MSPEVDAQMSLHQESQCKKKNRKNSPMCIKDPQNQDKTKQESLIK